MPKTNSLAVFDQYKQAINQSLAEYFQQLPAKFSDYDLPPIANHALELIAEFTLRPGKRVRGALAAMAYDNVTGQKLSANGLKLAVVMELIQTCALMEDDVTDKSDFRRGELTAHRMYERYDERLSQRDAEQIAFYTATITWYVANFTVLEIDEAAARVSSALGHMQKNITLTTFGQLDDITQEIYRQATTEEIIRKYSLKTSYYTFVNPLQAGLALAGITDQKAFDQVARFGEFAGIAFQAHDDYLGIFGGTETGKPNTDDISEGKVTVLTQYALEHGTPEQVAELKQYLGSPKIGEREVRAVQSLLVATGATIEARRIARHYADQAIQALEATTIWQPEFSSRLAELVEYSINRQS